MSEKRTVVVDLDTFEVLVTDHQNTGQFLDNWFGTKKSPEDIHWID